MNDLISREAAIELCDWYEHEFCECDYVIKALADDLKSLPTAEKQGKWINHRNDEGHNIADCDQCGEAMQWFDDDIKPNYCPNCGARIGE